MAKSSHKAFLSIESRAFCFIWLSVTAFSSMAKQRRCCDVIDWSVDSLCYFWFCYWQKQNHMHMSHFVNMTKVSLASQTKKIPNGVSVLIAPKLFDFMNSLWKHNSEQKFITTITNLLPPFLLFPWLFFSFSLTQLSKIVQGCFLSLSFSFSH